MFRYSRLQFQFAATAVAATLLIAVPAVAAESIVAGGKDTAVTANAKPFVARHRVLQGSRLATSRSARRHAGHVNAVRSRDGCPNVWCGRQVVQMVLILGIGF